jgi:hypothetical protein
MGTSPTACDWPNDLCWHGNWVGTQLRARVVLAFCLAGFLVMIIVVRRRPCTTATLAGADPPRRLTARTVRRTHRTASMVVADAAQL